MLGTATKQALVMRATIVFFFVIFNVLPLLGNPLILMGEKQVLDGFGR